MSASTGPAFGLWGRVLVAFLAAAMGALAQGYVTELNTGARLTSIEVRLASVERTLNTITCVELRGVPQVTRGC